jgi:hypothetical protein
MSSTRISQCNTSSTHGFYQSVYSGLRTIGPLLLKCYPKLSDITWNWKTGSDTSIQSVPNVLYGWIIGRIRGPIQYLNILSWEEWDAELRTGVIMMERNFLLLDKRHYNRSNDLIAVLLRVQVAVDEMQGSSLCAIPAHTMTPPSPWSTLLATFASAKRSPVRHHTRCLPPVWYTLIRDPSVNITFLHVVKGRQKCALAHTRRFQRHKTVRSSPRWGRRTCNAASQRQLRTFWAEIRLFFTQVSRPPFVSLVGSSHTNAAVGCNDPSQGWSRVSDAEEVGWQSFQFVGNALVNELWYCGEHSAAHQLFW